MLTAFGAAAVTFMMLMYALERRHRRYILGFACGCALSSVYGFLSDRLDHAEGPSSRGAGVALNRFWRSEPY